MIGVAFEKGFDLSTILVELLLEGAQEFTQAQGQPALGLNDRFGNLELIGLRKDRQSPGGRFRSPEFVSMEELFPTTRGFLVLDKICRNITRKLSFVHPPRMSS